MKIFWLLQSLYIYIVISFFIVLPPLAYGVIEIYPGPGGDAYKSDQYQVEVYTNGQWVESYTYLYSRLSLGDNYFKNQYPTVSWTTIGINEKTLIRVKKINGSFTQADVLPFSYGTVHWIDGSYVYLYIKQNQKIGIKFDNSIFHTMHVFANPPKPTVPAGAIYFGPGIHDIGLDYTLPQNKPYVYLDGGAWVKGTLNLRYPYNIEILGPGILSGESWNWEDIYNLSWNDLNPYMMIHASDANGGIIRNTPITIRGVTLVAAPFVSVYFQTMDPVEIDNVHILSPWTYNTDGFDVVGDDTNITNCFTFNNDNALIPEFIWAGDYNVNNCVINARTINVGYGYFTNLTTWAHLENIDIIYPEFATLLPGDPTWHGGAFDAKLDAYSSDVIVENQIYDNIVLYGNVDQLFDLTVEDTPWGAPNPALGNMRDIYFSNLELLGSQQFKSVIQGKDSDNRFYDMSFTNIKIDGEYLDAYNYQDYFEIGPYADNILFKVTDKNLLDNAGFERSFHYWSLWSDTGAVSWFEPESDNPLNGNVSGKFVIDNGLTSSWQVAVIQPNIVCEAGKEYEIYFKSKADATKPIEILVQQNYDPWTAYGSFSETISTTNELYGPYKFTCPVNDSNLRFALYIGGNNTNIWFDDMILKPINTVRNYEADHGSQFWDLWTISGADGTLTTDSTGILSGQNSHKISLNSGGTALEHAAMVQKNIVLEEAKTYSVSFAAKADTVKPIQIMVQNNGTTWTNYWNENIAISTTAATYGPYVFTASQSDDYCILRFNLGSNSADIWLDQIELKEGCDYSLGDLNKDCRVDILDFLILAENWLKTEN